MLRPAVQSGMPPPPPWYADFVDESAVRNPPPVPTTTYSVFSTPYLPDLRDFATPSLDSDTKLHNDDPSMDLRLEFKRLLDVLVATIDQLLDQMAKIGHPDSGNPGSTVKSIVKVMRNLDHILTLLREWQLRDSIVDALRRQLRSCESAVQRIDTLLANYSYAKDTSARGLGDSKADDDCAMNDDTAVRKHLTTEGKMPDSTSVSLADLIMTEVL